MKKKHRNSRKGFKGDVVPITVKRNELLKEVRAEIPLTEEDRIIYVYKVNSKRIVREITSVSYNILIGDE